MKFLTVGTRDASRPGEAVACDRAHVGAEDLKSVGPIDRLKLPRHNHLSREHDREQDMSFKLTRCARGDEPGSHACDLDRLDFIPGDLLTVVAEVILDKEVELATVALNNLPSNRVAVGLLDHEDKIAASLGGLHIRKALEYALGVIRGEHRLKGSGDNHLDAGPRGPLDGVKSAMRRCET